MPDNDFWIGQEQIPVDLSLLLTYHNDEDYWYAPGEYALRVYTVDTLNTNFARPCFALGERTSDPEMEDVSGAIENTLHELLDSGATPEDVYRIMGLVKESELSPETKEADSYLPIDLGYCIDGNIVSYEAVPEGVATVPENVDYPRYAEAMESHVPLADLSDADFAGLFPASLSVEQMSACAYAVNRCGYNTPLLMMTMQACADMNAQQLMAVFDATAAEFSDATMAKVSTILMHTPALTSQQMRYLLAEARDGTPFPALESMKEHLPAQAEPEKAQVTETGIKSESRDMASGKEALAEQAGLDGTQKINQNKEME